MEIIIIGAFSEVIELAELCGHQIIGIFDHELKGEFNGYPILGNDTYAVSNSFNFNKIPVVISPDLPGIRQKLFENYSKAGFKFCNLISPLSTISKSSTIGLGNVIQSHVNLSANATINNFVKLNTYSNVMHDTEVGDFSTIAPNAVLLGRVKVGRNSYIGSNATILPGREIGMNVIVGAGAVVTKDIKENMVCVGNPARIIRKNDNG